MVWCPTCRYLQRLAEELLHNLRLSNRAASQCLETVLKREQATTSLASLQPQYSALVARTRTLQAQVRHAHVPTTLIQCVSRADECRNLLPLQEQDCEHHGRSQSNIARPSFIELNFFYWWPVWCTAVNILQRKQI